MIKLLEKQNEAIYYLKNNFTKELIYGGAAGGGKTGLGVWWLTEACQLYPGTRWGMFRKELARLKETTLISFFDESKRFELDHLWEYKQQKGLIEWYNGSQIVLKELKYKPTDPNFDDLGSLELTGAFVDEIAQIEYKAWQVLQTRLRYKLKDYDIHGEPTKDMEVILYDQEGVPIKWMNSRGEETEGLIPKILGTCNPSKNWSYKLFYLPHKNKELPKERAFVQALPKDNPHLPSSYIDNLDKMEGAIKRRLKDGDWEYDDDKATLIDYKAIKDYWNGSHIKPEGKKYLTIDVARKGKDKTIFRVWHGWVCIARFEMPISKVNEVVEFAKKIQTKYGITNSHTIADEDGVGGGVVDYLDCEGFVNNSKPIEGKNYANLKSQCSIMMARKINSREVAELCTKQEVIQRTTEEMEQIKLKDIEKDGKLSIVPKEKIERMIGRSTDEWDSIMMRYWFELEGEFWII